MGLASPNPNPNPNGVRAHRAPLEVRGVLMARVGWVGLVRSGVLRCVLQVDQLVALVEHHERAAAANEGVALVLGAWGDIGEIWGDIGEI